MSDIARIVYLSLTQKSFLHPSPPAAANLLFSPLTGEKLTPKKIPLHVHGRRKLWSSLQSRKSPLHYPRNKKIIFVY
jgi:hypothetical protein